jgi:hypothetical protein
MQQSQYRVPKPVVPETVVLLALQLHAPDDA